ncbi:MAG: hypothetical protein Tsb0014_36070 [Pleurocapsa sp.]
MIMSQKTSAKLPKKPAVNSKLSTTIVHKPFATGKINIFHPFKSNFNGQQTSSKLALNTVLEKPEEQEQLEQFSSNSSPFWLNRLLNPWGISAIAIVLTVNLISSLIIIDNSRKISSESSLDAIETESPNIGHTDLSSREFLPLNLSTLSSISTHIDRPQESDSAAKITPDAPIHPGLVSLPEMNALSQMQSQYYYVLTEYTGEQSLKLAKEQVKNISLVNFPQGVFIYLGAFTEKSQANAFIQQLKEEELDAYIYPFD